MVEVERELWRSYGPATLLKIVSVPVGYLTAIISGGKWKEQSFIQISKE